MTLTDEETKELTVLSEMSTDYMCADAMMSHAVHNLKSSADHLKEIDNDTAYEIHKIINRIEDIKEENKVRRNNIKTRIEQLWERYDD